MNLKVKPWIYVLCVDFLLFVLCLIGASIYAQSMKVTGKVVDGDGLEVIGASVVVKGCRSGYHYRPERYLFTYCK